MSSNKEEQMANTLQLIERILGSYLDITVGEQKFKGKIQIEINCNDGGIGNVGVVVSQNFTNKSIDNLKKF